MNEFIKKLIERLEEYKDSHLIERNSLLTKHCEEKESFCEGSDCTLCVWDKAISIVNQLAEEYNNDVCEWNYSALDEDLIRPYHHKDSDGMYKQCLKSHPFCSCCGKKIKVVE